MTHGRNLMQEYNALSQSEREGKKGRELAQQIREIQKKPLASAATGGIISNLKGKIFG